jgi:hypothetical protein
VLGPCSRSPLDFANSRAVLINCARSHQSGPRANYRKVRLCLGATMSNRCQQLWIDSYEPRHRLSIQMVGINLNGIPMALSVGGHAQGRNQRDKRMMVELVSTEQM